MRIAVQSFLFSIILALSINVHAALTEDEVVAVEAAVAEAILLNTDANGDFTEGGEAAVKAAV
ncbi:MAG: hypothetical protein HOD26_14695, partial [Gammaproteobacteria bacterium]|nr:hypothetical protein [Gammaproteobacteria bacterium]